MSSKKKMKKFMGVVVTATGTVITGLAIIEKNLVNVMRDQSRTIHLKGKK